MRGHARRKILARGSHALEGIFLSSFKGLSVCCDLRL